LWVRPGAYPRLEHLKGLIGLALGCCILLSINVISIMIHSILMHSIIISIFISKTSLSIIIKECVRVVNMKTITVSVAMLSAMVHKFLQFSNYFLRRVRFATIK